MAAKEDSIQDNNTAATAGNRLFPIFLKLEQLSVLIVGGGYVGMEKLSAILNNAPAAKITLVAPQISEAIADAASQFKNIHLVQKPYDYTDLEGHDIVIAALNDQVVSKQVATDAKNKKILVNAADKPELCDFYLGSVVKKGNCKIAISTNGKSPTIAKRIKEFLNDVLPEEIDELLNNMESIRNKMSGDFTEKVKQLNEITKTLSK
jgi:siroheme synthase-like protein